MTIANFGPLPDTPLDRHVSILAPSDTAAHSGHAARRRKQLGDLLTDTKLNRCRIVQA